MSNERTLMAGNSEIESQTAGASHDGAQFETNLAAATRWLAPLLITAAVLVAYLFAPATPPLLDEQFFLKWTAEAGRKSAPLIDYLMWNGYSPADLWGPFTNLFNKISYGITFGAVPLLRIEGMVIHAAAAYLLFLCSKRLWSSINANPLVPMAAAVLFAAYPINAEAVSWFGGRGLELAGLGFITSLYCYLRARDIGNLDYNSQPIDGTPFNWTWMVGSLVAYAAALMSSSAIWSSSLVFAVIELWLLFTAGNKQNLSRAQNSSSLTLRVVGPLAMVMLTAAYIAANGTIWQLTSSEIRPEFAPAAIGKTFKALFFPINEAIWHKYAYAYDILYVLFPPFIALFIAGLVRNPKLRTIAALSGIWFLIAVLPELGHIAKNNLFGSRLFYPAAMPLACLLASIFCSAPYVIPRWRIGTGAISTVGVLLLSIFYLAHITNQNMAWRNGGRQIAAVQKSLAVIQSRTNAPYILASEIPSWVAVSPRYATDGIVVFDGKTRLLAAGAVSPGRLKDALAVGKYSDVTVSWNEDIRSFMPIDTSGFGERFTTISAKDIASRFVPAIEFFKTAHFDAAQDLLILESNNDKGPAMRIASTGLSAGGKEDYLYIDARIEAPASQDKPIVEMYWQTGTHTDYDNKKRRVWTKAFIDGNYHRYYLPMRTEGWIASGPLMTLTFGFPAGAKVTIKEMGVEQRDTVSPMFDAIAREKSERDPRFDPPYYNFPNEPDLGLFTYPRNAPITVSHDCSRVNGATGVAVEISMPDKIFPNPNGNEPSGVGGKTIVLTGESGTYELMTRDFPTSGVYGVRAIAIDNGHKPIGQYSDAVYCLVRTTRKNGWVEQLQ